jgi:WD40 repeat protein
MATTLWLPSAIVRQRDGLVAAVLEPRRVQVLNLAADCHADRRTLAEVGVCGHSISALLLDPNRDVVYTCGSDATLRAWNIKSRLVRWVWTDNSVQRTTLGQLRIRNARRDAVDQQWRHKRNYSRMSGEPRLFVTKETLWVSGPSSLRAFDRRRGRELWTLHSESVNADASLCVAHDDLLVSVQHESTGRCQMVAYVDAGVELWRQQLNHGIWVHWLVGLSNQLYYVQHMECSAAHGGRSQQELVSRDLATGEVRWSCPHDRENSGLVVKLEACGGTLWCFCGAGRELRAIDPSNGLPRWSIELTTHVHTHGYFLTKRLFPMARQFTLCICTVASQ